MAWRDPNQIAWVLAAWAAIESVTLVVAFRFDPYLFGYTTLVCASASVPLAGTALWLGYATARRGRAGAAVALLVVALVAINIMAFVALSRIPWG